MKVIVFTMDGCPWCSNLKEQLDAKGIEYEAKDVDEFSTMYNKFVKLTKNDFLPAMLIGKNALVPQKSFNTIDEAVNIVENLLTD
jgi:glutaredoxin|tara:strand:- start:968 stop:1222 length:255 start_codon:yes stop_codon:yes gene_type:complete